MSVCIDSLFVPIPRDGTGQTPLLAWLALTLSTALSNGVVCSCLSVMLLPSFLSRSISLCLGKQSYNDFVGKAAMSRRMPLEDMQRRAQGRVWTGVEAKALVREGEWGRSRLRVRVRVLVRVSRVLLPLLNFCLPTVHAHLIHLHTYGCAAFFFFLFSCFLLLLATLQGLVDELGGLDKAIEVRVYFSFLSPSCRCRHPTPHPTRKQAMLVFLVGIASASAPLCFF